MTRKSNTDFAAAKNTARTVDPLRAKATQNTSDTKGAKGTPDTDRTEYRFNARFTPEQWHFLEEKKWQESAKNHKQTSITAILQQYVEADMKKHPEILKSIDELNS